jgi:hypothetical protein
MNSYDKSESYWEREKTDNGRKINDALDKHQESVEWAKVSHMSEEDQIQFYGDLKHALGEKAQWRAEFEKTGVLITPRQREDAALETEIAAMQEARRPRVDVLGRDEEGRLHRDPQEGPAQVTYREEDWGEGEGMTDRTELYVVHGELIARAEFHRSRDLEGSDYTERWYDPEGKLHSFNGNPSEIIESSHHIPSETYLDESTRSFHKHGDFIDRIDTTYEDIVSHKPATVRQAFGYDIDGPEVDVEASRAENYAGRFDAPTQFEFFAKSGPVDMEAARADVDLAQDFFFVRSARAASNAGACGRWLI